MSTTANFSVALIGPPGSGKTTLAKRLVTHTGLAYMCYGDIIREIACNQPGHPHYNECVTLLQQGGRAGPWIDCEGSNFIGQQPQGQGCILEGMRERIQLESVRTTAALCNVMVRKVFVLDHPDDEVLIQRRLNGGFRINESENSIRQALADYRINSAGLMIYARNLSGRLTHELDSRRPLDDLFAEMLQTLQLA